MFLKEKKKETFNTVKRIMLACLAIFFFFHFTLMHGHFFCEQQQKVTQEEVGYTPCLCCHHFNASINSLENPENQEVFLNFQENHCNCSPIIFTPQINFHFSFQLINEFYSAWWGNYYLDESFFPKYSLLKISQINLESFYDTSHRSFQSYQIRQTVEILC